MRLNDRAGSRTKKEPKENTKIQLLQKYNQMQLLIYAYSFCYEFQMFVLRVDECVILGGSRGAPHDSHDSSEYMH